MAPLELPDRRGYRPAGDRRSPHRHGHHLRDRKPQPGPVPNDLAATEHQIREQLVEGIVVGDDDLMERYLEGDDLSSAEIEGHLAAEVAEGKVFPVVCGSAATGVGVERLASLLAEMAPIPSPGPRSRSGPAIHSRRSACDPDWPTTRPRVQDHDRSLRGQDLPPPRPVRHHPDRQCPHQYPDPQRRAAARARAAAGQGGTQRHRGAGRGHRGRTQTRRRPHRRHAGPQGGAGGRPTPAGGAGGAVHGHQAQVRRRR